MLGENVRLCMCLKCTGLKLNPICSESASSPSTEEDAIQGMLSMAGLLYSHPSEDPSSSQESWWSRTNHPSPDYSRSSWEFLELISVFSDKMLFWWTIACVLLPFSGRKEVASREENQDSDSSSSQVNPILIWLTVQERLLFSLILNLKWYWFLHLFQWPVLNPFLLLSLGELSAAWFRKRTSRRTQA